MPGRHDENVYRYGFQGQEKDDEIKNGEGTSLNYEYRMHDPRVGRFFAVDPLTSKYPHYSPYSFSGNRVIDNIELEGLENTPIPQPGGRQRVAYLNPSSGRIVHTVIGLRYNRTTPNPRNLRPTTLSNPNALQQS